MELIFARQLTVSSALLRLAQWFSLWSHVGIADGPLVIEALALHGGVVATPRAEFMARVSEWQSVEVPVPDEHEALWFARQQVGKPYDWLGVLGIAFRERAWAEPDSWYCTELAEAALAAGGLKRWRDDVPGITLNMSYYASRG